MDECRQRLPAHDPAEVRSWHEDNRRGWEQGAVHYTEERQAALDFLRGGASNLHPIERRNLGELASWCSAAVHLQCASGKDTLSLLAEGVKRVVGVDFSAEHIANARWLAEQLGDPNATFYHCDVLDVPAELDGCFDLVYTGRGALTWLADLDAWAAVVARLLVPGGVVHNLDDHPFLWLIDQRDGQVSPTGWDYFGGAISVRGWGEEYLGDLGLAESELIEKHERVWTIADVFEALTSKGLRVEHMGEHPDPYWDNLSSPPDEVRARLPLTFSVLARKKPAS